MTKLEIGSLMAIGPLSLYLPIRSGASGATSPQYSHHPDDDDGAPLCWPKRSFMRRPMPGSMEP